MAEEVAELFPPERVTSAAKAVDENKLIIAAVNRCATQRLCPSVDKDADTLPLVSPTIASFMIQGNFLPYRNVPLLCC